MMITLTNLIERFENYKTTEAYKEDDMYFNPCLGVAVYAEEHGQGYIIDVVTFKENIVFDLECATACYYWFEDGQLKTEPFNFKNDPNQYKRNIKAGHHVIYETMYFVPFYK